jgi:hypothetical protein
VVACRERFQTPHPPCKIRHTYIHNVDWYSWQGGESGNARLPQKGEATSSDTWRSNPDSMYLLDIRGRYTHATTSGGDGNTHATLRCICAPSVSLQCILQGAEKGGRTSPPRRRPWPQR